MISKLVVSNFKCFDNENLAFSKLSILSGPNGAGKSTILQALILAHAAQRVSRSRLLPLNGAHGLALGSSGDVYRNGALPPKLEVHSTGGHQGVVSFDAESNESLFLRVRRGRTIPALAVRLTYLTADRLGPRDASEVVAVPPDELTVGSRGEYTAQVLATCEREHIRDRLLHPSTVSGRNVVTLMKQTEYWMGEFVPRLELRANIVAGTNVAILRVRSSTETDFLKPTNVAFGVTHSLPIIVQGLRAAPGSILVVENPEAHLHPRAQSRMGRFLAHVASAGVQVVVETHSDHLLNGVRIAVADELLKARDVVIHHLGVDPAVTRAIEIGVSPDGSLSEWPQDFFDQAERDLATLVRTRMARKVR